MDYEQLRNELVGNYSNLSHRLQRITRYAMSNPNDMALETILVIAERADVPPSSLVRFGKSLGITGFREMQKVFQQELVKSYINQRKRVQTLNRQLSLQGDVTLSNLENFIYGGIEALHGLLEPVTDDQIKNAASILAKANVIHVAYQHRSFPIAVSLTYPLSHVSVPNILLDRVCGMFAE